MRCSKVFRQDSVRTQQKLRLLQALRPGSRPSWVVLSIQTDMSQMLEQCDFTQLVGLRPLEVSHATVLHQPAGKKAGSCQTTEGQDSMDQEDTADSRAVSQGQMTKQHTRCRASKQARSGGFEPYLQGQIACDQLWLLAAQADHNL